MIFIKKQIKEFAGISRKERRALIHKNRWNMYNHWQGWMGYLLFVLYIAFMMSSNYLFPKEVSLQYRLSIMIRVGIIVLAIHRICFLTTIAPYIRRDLS